jgi:hypothetical protein
MRIEKITYNACRRGRSDKAELYKHADDTRITLILYRSPDHFGIDQEIRRAVQACDLQRHIVELQPDIALPLFELAGNLDLPRKVSQISPRDTVRCNVELQSGSEKVNYSWTHRLPSQWEALDPIVDFMKTWLHSTDWKEVPILQLADI